MPLVLCTKTARAAACAESGTGLGWAGAQTFVAGLMSGTCWYIYSDFVAVLSTVIYDADGVCLYQDGTCNNAAAVHKVHATWTGSIKIYTISGSFITHAQR